MSEKTVLEPWSVGPITRTDIVRYQGASGDFNAIHHDELFAHAAGFPSVFSAGMFQAGVLACYAAERLGPENVRAYRARFHHQVWPGDVLTCAGSIVRHYQASGEHRLDVELQCRRQTGEVAVQAWATFAYSLA